MASNLTLNRKWAASTERTATALITHSPGHHGHLRERQVDTARQRAMTRETFIEDQTPRTDTLA